MVSLEILHSEIALIPTSNTFVKSSMLFVGTFMGRIRSAITRLNCLSVGLCTEDIYEICK